MINSAAFSLLELLIVIAISSILATIGIASWQDLQDRNELSGVTFGILQFLNEVKMEANHHNDNQSIYFVKLNNQEWCLVANKESLPQDDCNAYHRFISTYKNIQLSGLKNDSPLIFYGRNNTAKAGTIRLNNRIGETQIIISVPGRVRSCSYRTYLAGFRAC